MATEIDDTLASARPAGRKMPTLVIADRHEIEGAGLEALLQAGAYNIIGRWSHEDELLRFVEVYRPDIILLTGGTDGGNISGVAALAEFIAAVYAEKQAESPAGAGG